MSSDLPVDPGPADAAPRPERREEPRRRADRELVSMLDRMADAFVALDGEGRCLYANARAAELLGRAPAELPGRPLAELLPADRSADADAGLGAGLAAALEEARATQRPVVRDCYDRVGDRWLEQRLHPTADGVAVILADVTAQRRATAAMRARKREFVALVEQSPDLIARLGPDLRLRYVNAAFERWTGRPRDALLGLTYADLGYPPEVVARCEAAMRRALAGETVTVEHEAPRPDGTTAWLQSRVVPELDERGRAVGVLVATRDLTEEHRAHAAAATAEARFRAIVDQSLVGVYVAEEGRLTYVNPTFAAMLGLSVEALLAHPAPLSLLAPSDAERVRRAASDAAGAAAGAAAAGGDVDPRAARRYELAARRADGTPIHGEVHSSLVQVDGRAMRVGVVVDRTAAHAAAVAQRTSEERFRAVFEGSALGIAMGALDGRVWESNPALQRILGYTADELRGMHYRDYTHPDDLHADDAPWAELLAGRRDDYQVQKRYVCRDGRVIDARVTIGAVRDADGRPRFAVGMIEDVTAQRRLEAQLEQARKLEAVGLLAGGVAHDFNNLLAVMRGNLDLVRGTLGPGHPAGEELDEMERAAGRAAALVQQLLAVGRRQQLVPRLVDLDDVVRGSERLLRRALGDRHQLVLRLDDGHWRVRADVGQLEQVLLNLVVNARDALVERARAAPEAPPGGVVTVSTAEVQVDAADARRWGLADGGAHVALTVADTGVGMDATTRAHLFEPFYTTKAPGMGTGLGLATVWGIVQQSGGAVRVESVPGVGSTFTVLLPRAPADPAAAAPAVAAPAAAAPAPATPAPDARPTVLLVEDEEPVRTTARRVLERAGFGVREAADGAAALALWEAERDAVALVLTDVRMPGMTGDALAARLWAERPDLPVLFMTGYATGDPAAAAARAAGVPLAGRRTALLEKPWVGSALLAAVRALLPAPAG